MKIFFLFLLLTGFASAANQSTARTETGVFSPQEVYPIPPKGTYGVSFLTRTEVNDAQITYSYQDWLALGLHGIRNHWPTQLELHYALVQLNMRLFRKESDRYQWNLYSLTGLGAANKLKGINRVTYLLGLETDYETLYSYWNLSAQTIGAADYDQKNFIRARGGFYPYLSDYNSLQTLLLMQALFESYAEHRIEWGPVLRFQYKNIATEFYGTFKGRYSFAWSVYY